MATDRTRVDEHGHQASEPAEAEGPGATVDSRRALNITWLIAAAALAVVILLVVLAT